VAVSSVALLLINHFRGSQTFHQLRLKIIAAVIMGLAVASMHYTAMLGVDFYPGGSDTTFSNYIDNGLLAAMVMVIVSLIQGGVFATTLLDESHELTIKRAETASALYDVLAVAHGGRPLREILDKSLDIILNVRWLAVESKGSIFLTDRSDKRLEMAASQNLGTALLAKCARVDFGTCLCGLAAQQRQIVYKSELDHDHATQLSGMQPHGHYCIPILEKQRTLGVINLYVKHGHQHSPVEVQFLQTVSNALASVIKQKQMEQMLEQMSYEDPLTGIANRRRFNDTLDRAVKLGKRGGGFGLLLVDLDRFKPVNDRYGHDVGDRLLIAVCRRIQECLREMDLFARMGGDEFAVLLDFVSDREAIRQIADRILRALHEPFPIDHHRIEIGASIGACIFPAHAQTPDALLKRADVALYQAKEHRSAVRFAQEAVNTG
jgi:diguanylate cyclase (GGDEF)-like protein